MAKVKVRAFKTNIKTPLDKIEDKIVRARLASELEAYLDKFNDNDELEISRINALIANWQAVSELAAESDFAIADAHDSKNLRARFLTLLSKSTVASDPAKAISMLSVFKALDKLKLNDDRFNALIHNIEHLIPADTDDLISCLTIMHNSKIPLTAGVNLQEVMKHPAQFKLLLNELEPLTKQRFVVVKDLLSNAGFRSNTETLAASIQPLQAHKLTISDNLPSLARLSPEKIRSISSLLEQTETGNINQALFTTLLDNVDYLLDPVEPQPDETKIAALAKYVALMSKAGISLDPSRLRDFMHLNNAQIKERNLLFEAFAGNGKKFFNGSSLSLGKYNSIMLNETVPPGTDSEAQSPIHAILRNIELIKKSGAITPRMLSNIINNQPHNTQTLLTHLMTGQKKISKARIDMVLNHAEHLTDEKMTELNACITSLIQYQIPLTKNNHLGTLMQMSTEGLAKTNSIFAAMKKVTPERLAIVLDNVAASPANNNTRLAESLDKLEKHNVPLSKHKSLAALLRMDNNALFQFNNILDELTNLSAPDEAFKALARKLPHLLANPGKMPQLVQLIGKMNDNNIPFVGGFLDKLLGKKDSISQLAKLSKNTLLALKEGPLSEQLGTEVQRMKGLKISKYAAGTDILDVKEHPAAVSSSSTISHDPGWLNHDPDFDDDDPDEEVIYSSDSESDANHDASLRAGHFDIDEDRSSEEEEETDKGIHPIEATNDAAASPEPTPSSTPVPNSVQPVATSDTAPSEPDEPDEPDEHDDNGPRFF